MDFFVVGLQLLVLFFQTFGFGFTLRSKLEGILKEKLDETKSQLEAAKRQLDETKSQLEAAKGELFVVMLGLRIEFEARLEATTVGLEEKIESVRDAQKKQEIRQKLNALSDAKRALEDAEKDLQSSRSQSRSADESIPSDTDSPR